MQYDSESQKVSIIQLSSNAKTLNLIKTRRSLSLRSDQVLNFIVEEARQNKGVKKHNLFWSFNMRLKLS
jgi:hypothetical protein